MIAWCGSRADGLGWLSSRCGALDALEVFETLSIEALDIICSQHPRRLILAVDNRLSYPMAEIGYLQRSWPEVPWALALGSWFDGSRRTGMGATSHLSLPWYRWWDGWRPWLGASNADLLDPWPQLVNTRSRSIPTSGVSIRSSGVILSHCRQTAEGWQAGLEFPQANSQILTLREFRSFVQAASIEPGWILWDDSCLNTFSGVECLSDVWGLFRAIRARFPGSVILAATSMPRWSDWQQWKAAGANELLAKPSQGILLEEILLMCHDAPPS